MNRVLEIGDLKGEGYSFVLAKLQRAEELLEVLTKRADLECEFKENKTFRDFFERLEKRIKDYSDEERKAIYWFIFTYLNRLKKFGPVKSSALTAIFDRS